MLKTRILTALALMPLTLSAIFLLKGNGWAIFALAICVIGSWEWARFMRVEGVAQWAYVALTGGLGGLMLYSGLSLTFQVILAILSLGFWCVVAPLWLKHKWKLSELGVRGIVGWLMLLGSWQGMLVWHERENGPLLLLTVLSLAWVADTAAYFAGRAFGKRKLAPQISPGKSWEGVIGAYVGITIYALLIIFRTPLGSQLGGYWLLPAAWGLTALSIIGDLLESLFKRQVGIKDSSNLLPGHGGVLDRIDSQLAVLPVSFAILTLSHVF